MARQIQRLTGVSGAAVPVWAVGMLFGTAAVRLLPHASNFTPVLAFALFGGARLRGRLMAVAVPLLAMLASDIGLEVLFGYGFHPLMPVVYGTIAAIALGGRLLRHRRGAVPVMAAAIGSAFVFFLVTNFAVWLMGDLYPPTGAGFSACYVAALPFFRNTLAGTLVYSTALFGGFALLKSRLLAPGAA